MANFYEKKIAGEIACLDFSQLEAASAEGCPEKFRNMDFMVTGPFVMETEGAFETEYLYEREKILQPDYLGGFGGERSIAPFYGLKGESSYLGCDVAVWTKGTHKWNTLLFEEEGSDYGCGEALYLTEQRNCIYYAAFYVRCEGRKRAVICYENSGCRLFLNGELISDQPYGRVKGMVSTGRLVPVTFEDGLNLLLFKIRPGYICDSVDLSMSYCYIYPVCAESGGLAVTHPARTGVFIRRDHGDRQVFPCFAAAFSDISGGEVTVDGTQKLSLGAMKAGECVLLRAELPAAGGTVNVPVTVEAQGFGVGNGEFTGKTSLPSKMEGEELVMTSFHFDTTYHQEQRVYALGAMYITREILKAMRRDPYFKPVISEVDYLHPYYCINPGDREFLREMFARGSTESDCFYNQPSELTSSGEGIVRNLVYGQLYHRDVMGRICDVYSPGDVFGHFNQMSQITAKGGCRGISWGKHIPGFRPSMRHVSPDGSWVNHRRGDVFKSDAVHYGLSFCGYDSGAMDNVSGFPVDGDLSWMAEATPKARFCVPSEMQNAVERDQARFEAEGVPSPFELTSRDMSLYHAGVALTRTDFKQANRLAENLLITAEKLSVIAAMNGAEYPELALDKAWRQVLCGQHHDSITGTNNEISFVDLMIEYREAVDLAADICRRASEYIASHICTEAGRRRVVLFNPHTWDRAEHVLLTVKSPAPMGRVKLIAPGGKALNCETLWERETEDCCETGLSVMASVPACGYLSCYLEADGDAPVQMPKCDGENTIENEFYRITVDPEQGGGIVSLFDKENDRELINPDTNGPANRIAALKETHDRMETQHEFYTTGHKLLSDWEEASVERTVGEEFSTLTVRYDLGNVVGVTQEITLRKGERRIDFETRLDDYRDEDDLFTVTFPVDIKGARPIFDDRFAPQVRTSSRRALSFRTHQMLMASHCAVYSANQWMDYGPSVTLRLWDGEKTASLNIGMTQLIRAEARELGEASDTLLMVLTKKAVPVTPFPDREYSVRGSQIPHFNEDLTSDTRFVLSVEGVENRYESDLARRRPEVWERIGEAVASGKVAVAFIKDGDNDWNKPIDVILVKAPTPEALKTWAESFASALSAGHTASLEAVLADDPEQADDYGVAVINTGNIACSVEKGGMLNLMLFHTAEFYGNIGKTHCGKKLVPEHKSHVFTYSLLPHAHSYREAELYRRALEKNDPLFALADIAAAEGAKMPESFSLLKSQSGITVTSVKAGGYPMASMKGNFGTLSDRGIAIRYFEDRGLFGEAKLELGFDAALAERANLLEEERVPLAIEGRTLTLPFTPHTVETIVLAPKNVKTGNAQIGAVREITEPTYVRSWEHDLGSMPMGYLALCAVIDRHPRVVDELSFEVDVSVANNHTDIPVSGTAKLCLPEGWSANVTEIPYSLEPEGCSVTPVRVTKPASDAKGMIRLEYSHRGQSFEDVYEVGYHNPAMNMVIEDDVITVTVINDTDETLRGELGLATPIETWGSMGGHNPFGKAGVGPCRQPVAVAPHSRRDFTFAVEGDRSMSFWAVAKLMVNGRIYFQGALHRPIQPHVLWSHVFINEVLADNGSLKKANALK